MHIQKAHLSFRDPLQPLQAVTHIIIHHTAEDGWDVYKTHEFHQNNRGWSGIGYNYFIEEDGTIYEGRGLHIGAHAKGYNTSSIGICISGNFDVYDPITVQMISLHWLCKQFMYQFSLDSEQVLGHRELDGVTKTCPGTRFSMGKLRHILSNNEKGAV
ncbi:MULTISPECIES: peptidoglycan recognition family protein [unclassified Bacillus (in: firmicutes)]|uniref:peptidoglycan recognition protein family protein n=1 Tax=unclassified Bacillus (in: firmicutes) TaxID=185979 RepID=UPI0008E5A8E9|nr:MULTISPECIES: peptidoglycan recognition family protein [unclassified Bacillus (in: firmicutes)]SFI31296.1 N-acetylmuramoyl-L-alanine amidase [Bacillus sp. 71mf]SFS37829.1 N-acetylmuramoyl-L-alanine amidase [Bacillus sp. 103mf]